MCLCAGECYWGKGVCGKSLYKCAQTPSRSAMEAGRRWEDLRHLSADAKGSVFSPDMFVRSNGRFELFEMKI